MTYSYVHNVINKEAFPGAVTIYNKETMVGRGRGKYRYRMSIRDEAEAFLRAEIEQKLNMPVLYIV